ncbi:uncharacterized protein LOC143185926 [Calliopsis andreniformis]|uniref:uncharacterized protein LOC143185926 n=1 Tax=Calliopsis andreniformis TaxID=337506 RepID=UPI003FCE15C5
MCDTGEYQFRGKMSHAKLSFAFYITSCCLFLSFVNACVQTSSKDAFAEQLTEENWDRMLIGEWMVEFYAPWCPACKALEPIWEDLASQKKCLNINVGKVDVTDSPGLSGRFMVTALPTIYHVKDGIFRQYKSPRDKNSLIEFVSEKTWEKIEPIPGWKSPTSIQMSVISQFFKMSQVLRGIHNKLMEDFGLPTWGSYLIFAVATIVLGTILGLFIVCLIDFIYPPKPVALQGKKKQKDGSGGFMQEKTIQDEELVENVKDDLVDEESEGEWSDVEEKTKDTENDSKTETSSPNVRKRKPRKYENKRIDTMKNVYTVIMVKSAKKRSLSESEVAEKTVQEPSNVNKVSKKKKAENGTAQNGQVNKEVKNTAPKKVQNEKKKDSNEGSPNKNKKQPAEKKERKLELLKKRQEHRNKRKQEGRKLSKELSSEDIKRKIQEIEKRGTLSKSAKRKLAVFRKLLSVKDGTALPKKQVAKKNTEQSAKKKEVQSNVEQKKKAETETSKGDKKKDTKQGSLLRTKPKAEAKAEDDDDDDEEEVNLDDNESEDEDESDVEEEEDDDEELEAEEEEDEEDDEDDEDDDDEKDEEAEEDSLVKPDNVKKAKGKAEQDNEQEGKKKRYVVFVGNIPYTTTTEDLEKHFLTKVSQVVNVRIPTKDNSSRGFAYIELANSVDFEKALSLNHSFIKGRRISVQYSTSNKKESIAKNFKLQALQKAGKLAGGPKKNFQKNFNKKGGKPNMQMTKT